MLNLLKKVFVFMMIKFDFLMVSGLHKFSVVKLRVRTSPTHEQFEVFNGQVVRSPMIVSYDQNGKIDKVSICINTANSFCDSFEETSIFVMDMARRLDEDLFSLSECA